MPRIERPSTRHAAPELVAEDRLIQLDTPPGERARCPHCGAELDEVRDHQTLVPEQFRGAFGSVTTHAGHCLHVISCPSCRKVLGTSMTPVK